MDHFLVLGSGRRGIVQGKDLIESGAKNKITLIDINPNQLKKRFGLYQQPEVSSPS